MKMKFSTVISAIFLMCVANYAQDSSGEPVTNKQLLEKIQSLEVELEKLKIETSDNGLLAKGATLDWGKGVFIGSHIAPSVQELNVGYTFSRKEREGRLSYPLSPSRDLRYSLGVSAKLRVLEASFDEVPGAGSIGFLWKVGSPVMLNFISFSAYLTPNIIWTQTEESIKTDSYFTETELGLDMGSDIEFWIRPRTSISVGYLYDPIFVKIKGDGDLYHIGELKMNFGMRFYLK